MNKRVLLSLIVISSTISCLFAQNSSNNSGQSKPKVCIKQKLARLKKRIAKLTDQSTVADLQAKIKDLEAKRKGIWQDIKMIKSTLSNAKMSTPITPQEASEDNEPTDE